MPTPTYTPIANYTLDGTIGSVTFSSLSQLYRDVIVIVSKSAGSSSGKVAMQFNGDTGTNYPFIYAEGSGYGDLRSAAGDGNAANWTYFVYGDGSTIFNIMDYSTTDKHKSVLIRNSSRTQGASMVVSRWANTSAITSIRVYATFGAGSTISLYGVAA